MDKYTPTHNTFNPDDIDFKTHNYLDEHDEVHDSNDTLFTPKPINDNRLIISGPEYFNNYELSWLDFNFRVLEQAHNQNNPLLERIKFIGIVCSNLDEFFQKRVGGLKRQFEAGVNNRSVDGLKPLEQLKKIRKQVKVMITEYRRCFFEDLIPALKAQGVHFKRYDELNRKEKSKADDYFKEKLFPILTPLVVDQSHPFPFISNKSRSFAIEIKQDGCEELIFARVKVPNNRQRWFVVSEGKKKCVLVNIDEIISAHINDLFPGAKVISSHLFRVTRNADLKRNEEEADDLLEHIEEELRERRFAEVVRLELDVNTPNHIKAILLDKLDISNIDVYEMDGPIGLADCLELSKIKSFDHLKFQPWFPVVHPVLRGLPDEYTSDIFSIIRNGDFIVHHPYHSFATSVQRFVEEASKDPNVLAIKQTLYRTSNDSPIMHSLMRAAETGKQVAVLVELKARFDEQQNIDWAVRLEKAGIHVSYGLPGLKIHSKITVVVREEAGTLKRYAHIGTGNYHPGTANLYEDIGLFTCNDDICADVSDVFNYLTGYAPRQEYRKLLVAPNYLRTALSELILFEINESKNGKPSRIICKMNSLEDPLLIQKFYEASQAGVQIDMVVRGVCRLKPGIEGLSENIRVHSIIGRFLEHSRLFYFMHGGKDLYYLGSADIMHRNLDARVEVLSPVEHPRLKTYLQFILFVCLRDNSQRWSLDPDGVYRKYAKGIDEYEVATHKILMHHSAQQREPVPRA